jgi:SAM-dependent methyltransferase
MPKVPAELADHPDRIKWNAKYAGGFVASFAPHRLVVRALAMRRPAGPVLDLACGPSGSALLAAAVGFRVTAVDASEVALGILGQEAHRRGFGELITLVQADLGTWRPAPASYALVLCTGYWDRALFAAAAEAVAADGLIGWEALTADARRARPNLPAEWCLGPGEPASLLPGDFTVVDQHDEPDNERGAKRSLLARRLVSARA